MTEYIVSVFGVRIPAGSESDIDRIEEAIDQLTEYNGVGHVNAAQLLKHFDANLDAILEASEEEILSVDGFGEKTAGDFVDRITSEEDKIRQISEEHDPTLDELEESDPFEDRMAFAGEDE